MSSSSPQKQSLCLEKLFLLCCCAKLRFHHAVAQLTKCVKVIRVHQLSIKPNGELCYVHKTEMLLQTCIGLLSSKVSFTLRESKIQNGPVSSFAGVCLDKMNPA